MGRGKSKHSVYVLVWEYRVKPGAEPTFEATFANEGSWTRLMRESDGYLSSDLIRGDADPSRYLAVDRWRSPRAFERFRTERADEIHALSEKIALLIERERQVGDFVVAEEEAG